MTPDNDRKSPIYIFFFAKLLIYKDTILVMCGF